MVSIHDVSSTYRVPLLLEEQVWHTLLTLNLNWFKGIVNIFREVLKLDIAKGVRGEEGCDTRLSKWWSLADRLGCALPLHMLMSFC